MKMGKLGEASQKTGYNQIYLSNLQSQKIKAKKSGNIYLVDLDELKQRMKR
jgi:hypothetical protein